MKRLMCASTVRGLDREELSRFKESFGPTAFTCDHFSCPCSVIGFSTEAFLQTHRTSHGPPLRCFEGCRMNDVGFSSVNVLRVHKRKHHASASRPDVPETFHKRVKGQAMSNNTSMTLLRMANRMASPYPLLGSSTGIFSNDTWPMDELMPAYISHPEMP